AGCPAIALAIAAQPRKKVIGVGLVGTGYDHPTAPRVLFDERSVVSRTIEVITDRPTISRTDAGHTIQSVVAAGRRVGAWLDAPTGACVLFRQRLAHDGGSDPGAAVVVADGPTNAAYAAHAT